MLSAVSLALFVDSGWYQLEGQGAEPMAWGRGQGCAFVQARFAY